MYLLITGATGLLGQYLLRDALIAGQRIAVLVRSGRSESARERVERTLVFWEGRLRRHLPRPVVLDGDLQQPGLGLTPDQRAWFRRNCCAVLHSAASLQFQADSRTGEPYRSNVEGTRNLIAACVEANVHDFHLVSTAYVCGKQSGPILEADADLNAPFRNDYERSKAQAERLVRSAFPGATIYRPSIVIGDSKTSFTSTFRGVYTPLQLAWTFGQQTSTASQRFLNELAIPPDAHKNLVPVDHVASAVMEILESPEYHGAVYHLTHPQPVLANDIGGAILQAVESDGLSRPQCGMADQTDLLAAIDTYRPYFCQDPIFDTSNARKLTAFPPPAVDQDTLVRLFRYAIEARFSRPYVPLRPATLDLDEAFQPLFRGAGSSATEQSLTLEVSGTGGGAWTVLYSNGRPIGARTGQTESTSPVLYGPIGVLDAVLRSQVSLKQAFDAGRLLLTGESGSLEPAERTATALMAFLQWQTASRTCQQAA